MEKKFNRVLSFLLALVMIIGMLPMPHVHAEEENTDTPDAVVCEHEWSDATCEAPKTCTLCSETEGEALGHSWVDANCVTAKTCSACGKTEGTPTGEHVFTVNKGYTEGDPGYTTYQCANCEATIEEEDEPAAYDVRPQIEEGTTVYRWEMQNGAFVTPEGYAENALTKSAGEVAEDGTLSSAAFTMAKALDLNADTPWSIKWETGSKVTGFLFSETSSHKTKKDDGVWNLFLWSRDGASYGLGVVTYRPSGSSANGKYYNDFMSAGTYQLINKVTTDDEGRYASNMLYFVVDGVEYPVNQETGTNYQSGWDIDFKYMGTPNAANYKLNGKINYIEVTIPEAVAAHVCEFTTEGETVEGDCQNSGYVVWHCECGETQNVPNGIMGDHKWNDATCSVPKTCSVCGKTEGEADPTLHSFTVQLSHTDADCQNYSVTVNQCAYCEETETVTGTVLADHVMGEWTAQYGQLTRSCTVCGGAEQTATYVWEMGADAEGKAVLNRVLGDGNTQAMEPLSGTVSATAMTAVFAIGETINLKRDAEWSIEWRAAGNKYFVLSNNATKYDTAGHQGIYRYNTTHGVHYYNGGNKFAAQYPGADVSSTTGTHVYLIKNVVTTDAENNPTNVVNLYIDGNLIGELNRANGTTNTTYLQENDLAFSYIGNSGLSGRSIALDYLMIYVPVTGCTHDWKDATCDEPKTCDLCGATEGEALGHDHTKFVETVKGENCQTAGYDVMQCVRCDDTKQVTNAEAVGDHSFTVEQSHTDGNCQTKGYTTYKCAFCDETDDVEDEAFGDHVMGAWTVENGQVKRSCTVCGGETQTATYVFEKVQDAEGAYYINDVTKNAAVTLTGGSITAEGVLSGYYATFGYPITLSPTEEWSIEWKTSGAWQGMLLSKLSANTTKNQSIYVPKGRASICVNHNTNKNHAAAVTLADYTDSHVYTLKNELVTVDGVATNEIKLYIDGNYISSVVEHTDYLEYIHTTDLQFNGIGTGGYPVKNANLDYLLINVPASAHEHDHKLTSSTTGADCKTAGVDTYTCECSDSYTKPNDKFGPHAYGDLIREKEAVHTETTLEPGVAAHYQCSVCEAYFDEEKAETTLEALTGETPVHAHDHYDALEEKHQSLCVCGSILDEDDHKYEAPDYKCVCEKVLPITIFINYPALEPNDASRESMTEDYGTTVTLSLAPEATGHTFVAYVDAYGNIVASEETDWKYTFNTSGAELNAVYERNEYTVSWVIDGEEYAQTKVKYGDIIEPPVYTVPEGYTFDSWAGIPETMPAMDLIFNATLICNHVNTKLVPNSDGKTHNVVCANADCEAVVKEKVDCAFEQTSSTTGANCQIAGVDTYTCACKNTYTEDNDKFGDHSFNDNKASDQMATPADCENAATYYVACDYCDVVNKDKTVAYGAPMGHSVAYTVTATTTDSDVCHKGHAVTGAYTTSLLLEPYCTRCESRESILVEMVGERGECNVVNATCTEDGTHTHTADLSHLFAEFEEAFGQPCEQFAALETPDGWDSETMTFTESWTLPAAGHQGKFGVNIYNIDHATGEYSATLAFYCAACKKNVATFNANGTCEGIADCVQNIPVEISFDFSGIELPDTVKWENFSAPEDDEITKWNAETKVYTIIESLPPVGHTFGETVAAKEGTCVAAGNEAYKQCTACKLYFAADAEKYSTDGETSSDAFNTEMDPMNHAGDKVYLYHNESVHNAWCDACEYLWDPQSQGEAHKADDDGYCVCGAFAVVLDFNDGMVSPNPPIEGMEEDIWEEMVNNLFGGFDATNWTEFYIEPHSQDPEIHMSGMIVKEGFHAVGLAYDDEGNEPYDGEEITGPTTLYFVWEADHVCADNLTHHEAVDATCTEAGNIEYWTCTCGVWYSDEGATKVIDDHDSVIRPATGHSYGDLIEAVPEVHTKDTLTAGVAAHYICSECGKYFDENKVETTLEALTGETPVHVHNFYGKDDSQHWSICSCGYVFDEKTNHTYDAETHRCNCDAEAPYVHVAGVKVYAGEYLAVDGNCSTTEKPEGGYAYLYKADGKLVLELNGYDNKGAYKGDSGYSAAIWSDHALTIDLKGENTITNAGNSGDGIYVAGNLTVTGNGALDMEVSAAGIYCWPGSATIAGGSISMDVGSYGVWADGICSIGGEVGCTSSAIKTNIFKGGVTGAEDADHAGHLIVKDGVAIITNCDHQFSEKWSGNETHHWHSCTVSGCVTSKYYEVYSQLEGAAYDAHSFGQWTYNAEQDRVERICEIGCGVTHIAKVSVDANGVVTGFETLEEALEAAEKDDIVALWDDVSIDVLELTKGISLELQGHVLTTDFAIVDSGNEITDYFQGEGLLKVAKENAAFPANHQFLPVWNGTDGYVFVEVEKFQEKTNTSIANKAVYFFLPELPETVHDYLAAGMETSGVELMIQMTWTRDGEEFNLPQPLRYSDELVKEFYEGYADGKYAYAYRLTVTGTDAIDEGSLVIKPYFKANGVTRYMN